MTNMEGATSTSHLVEARSERDFFFFSPNQIWVFQQTIDIIFFFSFLVDKVANIGFVKVVYLYLEGLSDNVADMGYFLELPESFF